MPRSLTRGVEKMSDGGRKVGIPMGVSEEANEIIVDILDMRGEPKEMLARISALPDPRERERIFEMINAIAAQNK